MKSTNNENEYIEKFTIYYTDEMDLNSNLKNDVTGEFAENSSLKKPDQEMGENSDLKIFNRTDLAQTMLYADHEIMDDIVIGPTGIQPSGLYQHEFKSTIHGSPRLQDLPSPTDIDFPISELNGLSEWQIKSPKTLVNGYARIFDINKTEATEIDKSERTGIVDLCKAHIPFISEHLDSNGWQPKSPESLVDLPVQNNSECTEIIDLWKENEIEIEAANLCNVESTEIIDLCNEKDTEIKVTDLRMAENTKTSEFCNTDSTEIVDLCEDEETEKAVVCKAECVEIADLNQPESTKMVDFNDLELVPTQKSNFENGTEKSQDIEINLSLEQFKAILKNNILNYLHTKHKEIGYQNQNGSKNGKSLYQKKHETEIRGKGKHNMVEKEDTPKLKKKIIKKHERYEKTTAAIDKIIIKKSLHHEQGSSNYEIFNNQKVSDDHKIAKKRKASTGNNKSKRKKNSDNMVNESVSVEESKEININEQSVPIKEIKKVNLDETSENVSAKKTKNIKIRQSDVKDTKEETKAISINEQRKGDPIKEIKKVKLDETCRSVSAKKTKNIIIKQNDVEDTNKICINEQGKRDPIKEIKKVKLDETCKNVSVKETINNKIKQSDVDDTKEETKDININELSNRVPIKEKKTAKYIACENVSAKETKNIKKNYFEDTKKVIDKKLIKKEIFDNVINNDPDNIPVVLVNESDTEEETIVKNICESSANAPAKETKKVDSDKFVIKSFLDKITLKNEIVLEKIKKVADKEKLFSCVLCGKYFKTLLTLRAHEQYMHINGNTYSCGLCKRDFKQKSNLDQHNIIHHSKQKPYRCKLCSKVFKQKSNLDQHCIIRHSDIRPFRCEICLEKFKQKSNLIQHVAVWHRDKAKTETT